jgi:transcriptional regulator with XRE-family HTH domain
VLNEDQVRRRLRAARELTGMSREELGDLLAEDGFGRHDVAALEREKGESAKARTVPLTPARRASLARHLGVPEAWFTEPDHQRLFVSDEDSATRERVEELAGQLADLRQLVLGSDEQNLREAVQAAADAERQYGSTSRRSATPSSEAVNG